VHFKYRFNFDQKSLPSLGGNCDFERIKAIILQIETLIFQIKFILNYQTNFLSTTTIANPQQQQQQEEQQLQPGPVRQIWETDK
jgi:hypothetical protein